MSVLLLVATPHASFGELIRLSLEEQGMYKVKLAVNAQDAHALIEKTSFALAILDSDLEDAPFALLCQQFRQRQPAARLVVIPPNNQRHHPSLEGIQVDGFLDRPFYLPDLLHLVESLIGVEKSKPAQAVVAQPAVRISSVGISSGRIPTRLSNQPAAIPVFTEAALQSLGALEDSLKEQLTASNALAALLIKDGQLYRSFGKIAEGMAEELTPILLRSWDFAHPTDLTRFVHPTSIQGDLLAYVTPIADRLLLALLFPPSISMRLVRPITRQMAQTLAEGLLSAALPPTQSATKQEDAADLTIDSAEDSNDPLPAFDLAALLGNIPSPNPGDDLASDLAADLTLAPGENIPPPSWSRADWDALATPDAPAAAPIPQPLAQSIAPPAPQPAPTPSLDDPQPQGNMNCARVYDPHAEDAPSYPLSLLTYTYLLVPRMPEPTLTGALAEGIEQCVRQRCLAFGWMLVNIALDPQYLQWTVQVAPSVSPGNVARIIRQHTSTTVFNDFPALQQQNPSGDFWTIGYLIVSGNQSPSAEFLQEYIQQARKRQGVPSTPVW